MFPFGSHEFEPVSTFAVAQASPGLALRFIDIASNVALNTSQVVSNLFTPLTGNEANLPALYRCEEGGGATVGDSAPLLGNNNGLWTGTPRFVPTVVASKPQNDGGRRRAIVAAFPGSPR